MNKNVLIISLLLIVFSADGCRSNEIAQSIIDSDKVDSLINVTKINERTIIVKFGYDAVTAIKTSEGIVLIDAGISTFLTERYKERIIKHFNLDNFIFVINSHGHHDHIRGNVLFPQAQILGHGYCRKDAPDSRPNKDSLLIKISEIINDYDRQLQHSIPGTPEWSDIYTQKIRYYGSYLDEKNDIPIRFPDITFSDSLKLECGDTSFEIIYFGKFHSNSDILIYVPEMQLLFSGDLFSKYGRPAMSDSSIRDEDKWPHSINWTNLRMNNIRTIIDGHGQILTIDDLKGFNGNLLNLYSMEGPE